MTIILVLLGFLVGAFIMTMGGGGGVIVTIALAICVFTPATGFC